jgi:FtsH-binding integral membrane protein
VALGLFLVSKQYAPMALPFVVFLLPQGRWKDYLRLSAQAIAVAMAVTAPLALWNLRSFWADLVLFQVNQPYRPDALSFAAMKQLPLTWILAAVAVAVVFCLSKSPRHPAMFAGCFGFAFLIFVYLNKQAFANYYFLISSSFWLAAATLPVPFGADKASRCSAAAVS